MNYLQIFSRHEVLLAFFCKLGHELYCIFDIVSTRVERGSDDPDNLSHLGHFLES